MNGNGNDNVENGQLQVSGYKLSKIDEEGILGFSDLENIQNESHFTFSVSYFIYIFKQSSINLVIIKL